MSVLHPEPDAAYRERLLIVAPSRDHHALNIAIGFQLDKIGEQYGLSRKPAEPAEIQISEKERRVRCAKFLGKFRFGMEPAYRMPGDEDQLYEFVMEEIRLEAEYDQS